ncbi:hypothetical protein SAMN05192558_106170 [Actinokineospora alba]|uniref:Uncharacterized protein n=1 Tax=Actinokineospora alba TaxID=504798 RepID=A0A1H0PLV6_9PSEU|nr:hypothetical protein [Actinokineospora alba]TDP65845.1 hypothetical protein C8E96_1337 [Actinokineospora alba]SDI63807.1 hypothetical protein SAMN05421871_106282 [Actinokineospora alba]SDP05760.1 hypothetical protein SAMN05192558_106170 [Actinokineospora alba]
MRWVLGVLLVTVTASACSTTVAGQAVPAGGAGAPEVERELVGRYFTDFNDAADEGPETQRDFLRRTQHPDFTDRTCDLGDLVLTVEPALSTLRTDAKWKPEDASKRPRGSVYVVGVSVRIRRDNATLAEQIGSQRVVVLDGRAYGFAPCPTR